MVLSNLVSPIALTWLAPTTCLLAHFTVVTLALLLFLT